LLRHFPSFAADDHLARGLIGMMEYAVEYGNYAPEGDLTWSRKIDPLALAWERCLNGSNWQGDLLSYGATSDDHVSKPVGRASGPRRDYLQTTS